MVVLYPLGAQKCVNFTINYSVAHGSFFLTDYDKEFKPYLATVLTVVIMLRYTKAVSANHMKLTHFWASREIYATQAVKRLESPR